MHPVDGEKAWGEVGGSCLLSTVLRLFPRLGCEEKETQPGLHRREPQAGGGENVCSTIQDLKVN